MNNKRIRFAKKGFTLVELIIVITIISILSVTAFIMLNKWLGKSRDARRSADLTVVEQGLTLYSLENNTLPKPYNYTGVYTDAGSLLRYQGDFGEETRKTIGNIASKVEDPNGGNYKYSLSIDAKAYQLSAVYENTDISYTNSAYAQNGVSKIQGTYGEYIIVNTGTNYYLRHIASMFVSGTLVTGNQNNYIYQDKKALDNQFFVKYTDITGLFTGADTVTVLSGVVNVFSGDGITNNEIASMTITNAPGGKNISSVDTTTTDDGSWCNYIYSGGTYHTSWTPSTELGYHDNKCYIFGDEDSSAIAACNQWVTDNATLGGTWIWVPARWFITDGNGTDLKNTYYQRAVTYNSHNYICRGFAVMKYEAKFTSTSGKIIPNATRGTRAETDYATADDLYADTVVNGGITSKASDYPITNLTQGEAIQACGTAGTYHLITDNEYMAIARNIEQQGHNRTSETVGNGGIYRGNVKLTDNMSRSSYAVNSKYTAPAGNDTDLRGDNLIGNRRLNLSNGSKVWDIAGNVWEHTNKSNNPSASNVRGQTNGFDYGTNPTIGASATAGWTEWTSVADRSKYGPSGNYNANNGVGQLYQRNFTIFIRGGSGASGAATAGVFTLTFNQVPTIQWDYIGFRCVR